mmetsp:Transcript_14577/g.33496  ORF Transcript_14577/g.33496 Transcript_14577/m.33496 type:complete len:85 (-) Transcript_14577:1902-2156(-)
MALPPCCYVMSATSLQQLLHMLQVRLLIVWQGNSSLLSLPLPLLQSQPCRKKSIPCALRRMQTDMILLVEEHSQTRLAEKLRSS